MIGHVLGGAGAIEAVACVKSIQDGVIHPTINYEHPDPDCDLGLRAERGAADGGEDCSVEQFRVRGAERLRGVQQV